MIHPSHPHPNLPTPSHPHPHPPTPSHPHPHPPIPSHPHPHPPIPSHPHPPIPSHPHPPIPSHPRPRPHPPNVPPRSQPAAADSPYVKMSSRYPQPNGPPISLAQQRAAAPNQYAGHQQQRQRAYPQMAQSNMGHPQVMANPSYGQMEREQPVLGANSPPPPLPPKPSSSRPLPNPPPLVEESAMAGVGTYDIVKDPKDVQTITQLNHQISDTSSQLKQRNQELSQAHHELKQTRQCLTEKKDELKEKDRQLEHLRAVNTELQQTVSGRMQPQMASNEAALRMEVQQYQRMVEGLRRELEQQRRQPPPPPAVDTQELIRLRTEVQWHQAERVKTSNEIGYLKSNEAVLSMQVGTYKEDFESERRDRERANEKIQQQKEELDNLNQIVAMLAPNQQRHQVPQEIPPPDYNAIYPQ